VSPLLVVPNDTQLWQSLPQMFDLLFDLAKLPVQNPFVRFAAGMLQTSPDVPGLDFQPFDLSHYIRFGVVHGTHRDLHIVTTTTFYDCRIPISKRNPLAIRIASCC
jgi:hypothetical protein